MRLDDGAVASKRALEISREAVSSPNLPASVHGVVVIRSDPVKPSAFCPQKALNDQAWITRRMLSHSSLQTMGPIRLFDRPRAAGQVVRQARWRVR